VTKEEKMEFKDEPLPNNFSRMIGFDQTHENDNRPEVGQSYDPELTALCLKCGQRLTESRDPVKFKVPKQPDRAYFYRVHKECDTKENTAKAIDMVNKQMIVEGFHRNAI
jgi:hypothetical protein